MSHAYIKTKWLLGLKSKVSRSLLIRLNQSFKKVIGCVKMSQTIMLDSCKYLKQSIYKVKKDIEFQEIFIMMKI